MDFPRAWGSAAGLVVGILLATACTAPEVLPPPATVTPAAQYLEQPRPVLFADVLVPQPANAVPTSPPSTPAPQAQLTPVPTPPSLCATVVTEFLNVRSSPGTTDENRVGVVQQGESFAIIGNNNDGSWFQVEIPRFAGSTWLYSDYVTEGPCR